MNVLRCLVSLKYWLRIKNRIFDEKSPNLSMKKLNYQASYKMSYEEKIYQQLFYTRVGIHDFVCQLIDDTLKKSCT